MGIEDVQGNMGHASYTTTSSIQMETRLTYRIDIYLFTEFNENGCPDIDIERRICRSCSDDARCEIVRDQASRE